MAACLITNSHYTGVYPVEIIANGGLIGDILFFAVSGYCLYNAKSSFPRWYGKRLFRIYPPVIIITFVYMVLGFYNISLGNAFSWFIYPTNYHFIASIVFLYIPYYIVVKIDFLRNHLIPIMLSVAGVWLFIYLVFYDKSVYHIDNVYEPMIRFLFFEAMLLGAYFRQNDSKYRNSFSFLYVCGLVISFVAYFASKTLFARMSSIAFLQPVNQLLIFILLYFLFRVFAGIDQKLEHFPKWLKKAISFISTITLEIYLVQYVIEDYLSNIAPFPINWIVLTLTIFASAVALHMVCKGFYYIVDVTVESITSIVKKDQE